MSMNTGRVPAHCTLNGVASREQPSFPRPSLINAMQQAASLSMGERPLVSPSDETHGLVLGGGAPARCEDMLGVGACPVEHSGRHYLAAGGQRLIKGLTEQLFQHRSGGLVQSPEDALIASFTEHPVHSAPAGSLNDPPSDLRLAVTGLVIGATRNFPPFTPFFRRNPLLQAVKIDPGDVAAGGQTPSTVVTMKPAEPGST